MYVEREKEKWGGSSFHGLPACLSACVRACVRVLLTPSLEPLPPNTAGRRYRAHQRTKDRALLAAKRPR
jgi:hypothetical protein